MFCSWCGEAIDDDSVFCKNCGYRFGSNQTNNYYSDRFQYQQQIINSLNNISQNTYSQKNKTVAGFLALFLGVFGAHNFYVGKTGKAMLQLFITVSNFSISLIFMLLFPIFSVLMFIAFIAVFIWSIVEAITFFKGRGTDKYGKLLIKK